MKTDIHINNHNPIGLLQDIFRQTKDATFSRHLLVIILIMEGKGKEAVSAITTFSVEWILQLVQRYNQAGLEGLGDLRRNNPGKQPTLTEAEEYLVRKKLKEERSSEAGLLSGPILTRILKMLFPKKRIGKKMGYRLLKKWKYVFRKPRPHHAKADQEAKKIFIRDLPAKLIEVQKKYNASPRLFFMDEHRMGLQPIVRKQWCLPETTTVNIHPGYEWIWVYGYVEPYTGENHHYILPRLNTDCFQASLDIFAKETKAKLQTPVLLVLDGASAHKAKRLQLPQGIELHFLPPYSPELQPAERLWPTMNECIANRLISTLKDLEDIVSKRCQWMMEKATKFIKGLTSFHWLPATGG